MTIYFVHNDTAACAESEQIGTKTIKRSFMSWFNRQTRDLRGEVNLTKILGPRGKVRAAHREKKFEIINKAGYEYAVREGQGKSNVSCTVKHKAAVTVHGWFCCARFTEPFSIE